LAGCVNTGSLPRDFSVYDVQPSQRKINAELRGITVTLNLPIGGSQWNQMPSLWTTALQNALDRRAVFTDNAVNTVSIQVRITGLINLYRNAVLTATYNIIDRDTGNVIYTHEITTHASDMDICGQKNIVEFLRDLGLVNLDQFFSNSVDKKISPTKGSKGR
jgi:hypothetical protein